MKTKLFALLVRLMYCNLSKGEYGCEYCRKSAEQIIKLLGQRKRIVIAFNPDTKLIHDENGTREVFMNYHISNITPV